MTSFTPGNRCCPQCLAPERALNARVTADGRFALVYCAHNRFGVLLDMHREVLAAAFEAAADECHALALRFIQAVVNGERAERLSNQAHAAWLN